MIPFGVPNFDFIGIILLVSTISLAVLIISLIVKYFSGTSFSRTIKVSRIIFIISVTLVVAFIILVRYISTSIALDVNYKAEVSLAFGEDLKTAVTNTNEFVTSERTHGFFGKLETPEYLTKKYDRTLSNYYHNGRATDGEYYHDFAHWGDVGAAKHDIDLLLDVHGKKLTFSELSSIEAQPYLKKTNYVNVRYQKRKTFEGMYADYEDAAKKITQLGWPIQAISSAKWTEMLTQENDGHLGVTFQPKIYEYNDNNYKAEIRILYYERDGYGYVALNILDKSIALKANQKN